jgi:hypothetical protein
LVGGNVVDAVGPGPALAGNDEVVRAHRLGPALRRSSRPVGGTAESARWRR